MRAFLLEVIAVKTTWNSRKRVVVDGEAFKAARVMFKSDDIAIRDAEYQRKELHGYGSQGWLAEKAGLSLRAISSLEGGKASVAVVDAVSNILKISGRQYILGYGEQATKVSASHSIDLRSTINGRVEGNEETYLNRPFVITLAPVNILIEDAFIEEAVLKSMHIRLSVGEAYSDIGKSMIIDLAWVYYVNLTSSAKTFLGDPEVVGDVRIKTNEIYTKSIMFRQESIPPTTWKKFCEYIIEFGSDESLDHSRLLLTLTLNFENFEKQVPILVSIPELKSLIENYYPKGCPYWIQPKALMP